MTAKEADLCAKLQLPVRAHMRGVNSDFDNIISCRRIEEMIKAYEEGSETPKVTCSCIGEQGNVSYRILPEKLTVDRSRAIGRGMASALDHLITEFPGVPIE